MNIVRIFIVVPIFISVAVFAKSLTSYLNNFHTFSASFMQKTISGPGDSQHSFGKIWIQKPGHFRWDIFKPQKQVFVSDGKTLWRYEPALLQVIVQPLNDQLRQTPLLLLSGKVKNLNTLFNVKSLSRGHFTLTPKQSATLVHSITLVFKKGVLREFNLESATGQRSQIIFSHIQLNTLIPVKRFQFKPPKGVDVLKN